MRRDVDFHGASARWHHRLLAVALLFLIIGEVVGAVPATRRCRSDSPMEVRQNYYYLPNGEDYRGIMNVTEGGFHCQAWNVQVPHAHSQPVSPDPFHGIGPHNYCRNPQGIFARPWCYTVDPSMRIDYCDVGLPCTVEEQQPSISFHPPSGTKLVMGNTSAEGAQPNVVSLSCFPVPCSIYVRRGGEPSIFDADSLYTKPLTLITNTTLHALARFTDDREVHATADYKVHQRDAAQWQHRVWFTPTPDHVYRDPTLVVLKGLTSFDRVLIFLGSTLRGVTYTGPLWLNQSTRVVAIVNETLRLEAAYTIRASIPPVVVYPQGGSFIGGVSVLVRQTDPRTTFFLSTNYSAWKQLSSDNLLIQLRQPGNTTLTIKAEYLGGLLAYAVGNYHVTAASPPQLVPFDVLTDVQHQPVTVACVDPIGRALAVQSNPSPPSPSPEESETDSTRAQQHTLSHTYTTPGDFAVMCSYVDDLGESHATTATIRLRAVAMATPQLLPPCGTSLPSVDLQLRARAFPMSADYTLHATTSPNARVQLITTDEADPNLFYLGMKVVPENQSSVLTLRLSTHPTISAFEQPSQELTCTYPLLPLGPFRSPLWAVQMECSNCASSATVDRCVMELRQDIARCLYLYHDDLIEVHHHGRMTVVQMTGLSSEAMRIAMNASLGQCLSHDLPRVSGALSESSEEFILATAWRVVSGNDARPTSAEVVAGTSFLVEVSGYRPQRGTYFFAPASTGCSNVGFASDFVLPLHVGRDANVRDSIVIAFDLPTPGLFQLCAQVEGDLYMVPSALSLQVVGRPFPELRPLKPPHCGGAVTSATNYGSRPLTFTSNIPSIGDMWVALDPPSPWALQPITTTVRVPGVGSSPWGMSIVSGSLGATSGAAITCIYYKAANPDELPDAVYSFRVLARTPQPSGLVRVVVALSLHASFSVDGGAPLIQLEVLGTPRNMEVVEVLGTTLATTSPVDDFRVALPDQLMQWEVPSPTQPDAGGFSMVVSASVDGAMMQPLPQEVWLSPLSLLMQHSTACLSGWSYEEACVCLLPSKHAIMCTELSSGDGESELSRGSSQHSGSHPSSATKHRAILLTSYTIFLLAVGAGLLWFIRRGSAARARAEQVTVEAPSPPV